MERDPLDGLTKRLAEVGFFWARTLAESYPLGNGRIGPSAADLKFLSRSRQRGREEKPRIDNKTTPSYLSARIPGAPEIALQKPQ
jgi:hypothetical protein